MVRRRQIESRADEPAGVAGDGETPAVEIPESDLRNELSVLAALISAGLARFHPEARRLFREEGVSVNGDPVLSDKAKLTLADVKDGLIKLSLGKDRHVLLKPV